ncbi:substrate-specific activator of APC-dependent proteolysis [Dissophora globulifera]|uniref:Substrate-specific activator of APC-dependent proteolysis n=1 Tax=Dissophora globulifera TaxID=979702 RepID=A0A9P6RR15_9FUNG|nr:substrate-specific activator of APC-dependent proteolysis [Dissophora globulifera]
MSMQPQFKKRVDEALQQGKPDEDSAARNNHALPSHNPDLLSPTSGNSPHARTAPGVIRTTIASARAARARGPPGTPKGAGIGRTLFGHTSTLGGTPSAAIAAAAAESSSSPRRSSGSTLVVPMSAMTTRRSSNAGLPSASIASAASGGTKKTRASNTASAASLSNIAANNGSSNSLNSNNGNNLQGGSSNSSSSSAANIANNNANTTGNNHTQTLVNQSTPTRLTATSLASAKNYQNNIIVANESGSGIGAGPGSSFLLKSPGLKSPTKKIHYDRFIPQRRDGALAEQIWMLPDTPLTPNRQRGRNMGMAHATDHYRQGTRIIFHYEIEIYSTTPVTQETRSLLQSPKKAPRSISKVPFKVLDAPDLKDDFYLNLVDWSPQNTLGVGLKNCVYLWSAQTSKVTQLCELDPEDEDVTSISWISMGTHLAVGTDSGKVQIWDVRQGQRVRTMTGHNQRVGVLAWSDHTLTSGSRDRNIYHRDVRSPEMYQHQLSSHTGEVCGLKWNSAGTQLASGGNDNKLMVWEKDSTVPLYKFRDHNAAVKALDWNPHQSGILASGGGTADRYIRFWNTTTGLSVGATDTGSQVCNLAWSKTTNELVSTHGYSQNQVVVWKYPSMQQIAALSGHQKRVLYLALSPDGQTIVTGAGDETLRFWNVFQKSKSERRDDDMLSGVVTTLR